MINPDDDNLHCFCGNYNSGYMIGTRRGGSILRVLGSIQRRNLRAAGFARAVGWGRIRALGRRVAEVLQRIVEVMTIEGVEERSVLVRGARV
jgi:hypothetical protein